MHNNEEKIIKRLLWDPKSNISVSKKFFKDKLAENKWLLKRKLLIGIVPGGERTHKVKHFQVIKQAGSKQVIINISDLLAYHIIIAKVLMIGQYKKEERKIANNYAAKITTFLTELYGNQISEENSINSKPLDPNSWRKVHEIIESSMLWQHDDNADLNNKAFNSFLSNIHKLRHLLQRLLRLKQGESYKFISADIEIVEKFIAYRETIFEKVMGKSEGVLNKIYFLRKLDQIFYKGEREFFAKIGMRDPNKIFVFFVSAIAATIFIIWYFWLWNI